MVRMMLSKLFSTSAQSIQQKYKVLIIGAGSGGLTVASQLSRSKYFENKQDILIVDPSNSHTYQPLLTFVGAGWRTIEESRANLIDLIPKNAHHFRDKVMCINPKNNTVSTLNGSTIKYEYLVIAPGLQIEWNKIPGLLEALNDPSNPVSTNYSEIHVLKTKKLIDEFTGGNALFTQPSSPINCASTAQKVMYLAEESIKNKKYQTKSTFTFHSGQSLLFPVEKYANALSKICTARDITVVLKSELTRIDPQKRQAIFKDNEGEKSYPYDFLHVTPIMGPPDCLGNSLLTNTHGFLHIDKHTLQSINFKNVFGLGDVCGILHSKIGADVACQSRIVVANLVCLIEGKKLKGAYDGYTSCPLITGEKKVILAEFDYEMVPKEVFPFVYWKAQLKGLWKGPRFIRDLLNLSK